MLSQKINRRDARMPGKIKKEIAREKAKKIIPCFFFNPLFSSFCFKTQRLGVSAVLLFVFLTGCSSLEKIDMRSLAPAESVVYLEARDLSEALQVLTENKAWEREAAEKPDFSQLKNIQVAVAVTGFETSEKQVADQSAILNFKPRFVLIAETRAWHSTAVSIVENQIGKFARKIYGEDVKLEKSDKSGARVYVWTSADGRKLFSAVSESLIYVGNDAELLDKCLSVRRGEAESLLKNENLESARSGAGENPLAFGYVTQEGVAQIAKMLGVSTAIEASEEDIIRSFVAKILPEVLQKSVREVVWTAQKTEQGIEDKIFVKTDGEVSSVFKETLLPATENRFSAAEFLPVQFDSITFYNLQNPQIGWRSALIVASNQMEGASGRILIQFSNAFFEPYGIADGETFLSAVGTEIVTARFDEEGEKAVVIADVKDIEKIKKTISDEINFKGKPEKQGAANVWQSEDKTLAAAFFENKIVLGDRESVLECLRAKESGKSFARTIQFQSLAKNSALAVTISKDAESAQKIIGVLGKPKEDKNTYSGLYTISTRFIGNGFERQTVSDFGLLGAIVERFGDAGK